MISSPTVRSVSVRHVELAQPKVAESDMARIIKQNILWLEITVNDIEAVQVLEREEQLCGVKPGSDLVELAFPLEVVEQLSTVDKGQDEVELFGRLEGELEGNDERAVDLGEDGALGEGVGDLAPGDDVCFADGLEGIDSEGVALAYLHNLATSIIDTSKQ
jgi:hypothetical protein